VVYLARQSGVEPTEITFCDFTGRASEAHRTPRFVSAGFPRARGLRDDFVMSATQRRRAAAGGPSADEIDAVLRASRALVGIAAASIAAVDDDVTVPQLRVLVMVDTKGPLNLAAVATGLGVNPSNASRICDRLIRAGLLDRQESQDDRRNIALSLTDAGRRLVNKMMKHRRTSIIRVLRDMDPDDRELLTTALDRFAAAAGEPLADDAVTLTWLGGR
jgi:DNA-binding MarR family transcriptional regulator